MDGSGRPLMIFESDFDTVLPSVDDLEENEDWSVEMALGEYSSPAPGRMISCFNAIAVLCLSCFLFSAQFLGTEGLDFSWNIWERYAVSVRCPTSW
jgi:hypothetical protein